MNPAILLEPRLSFRDYLLLLAGAVLLFGLAIAPGTSLTGHQSVLAQNSREMLAGGDFLVPTIGGEPWLERPPLPDWILCGVYTLFGTSANDRVARFTAAIMATLTVLLVGWMAGVLLGRRQAFLACLALATSYEFYVFATNPEADIFLCAIVTAALALFVKLEFASGPEAQDQRVSFLGGRSWTMLAFFFMLGLTNQAKGLIFGTLMVAVPVASFLLLNAAQAKACGYRRLRRYVWLWGWLLFLAVSLAWPLAVYVRYPEIRNLWLEHYLGRFCKGYMREPVWYYLATLPVILLPWTWPALVGLWQTRKEALTQAGSRERFLWCWALLVPLIFSIPQGKHHHYLLHCLPAWALLAGRGAVVLWEGMQRSTGFWSPVLWSLLLLAIPGDVALVLLQNRVPGPAWLVPVLLLAWPLLLTAGSWLLCRQRGGLALGGLFGLLLTVFASISFYEAHVIDGYGPDRQFLRQARKVATFDRPLFACFDWWRPLETFWLLYHADSQVILVRDMIACWQHPRRQETIYILARRLDRRDLEKVGTVEEVLASQHTRAEKYPEERRVLFRLRFHPRIDKATLPSLVRYNRGILF